jgi:hypothetical protein
VAELGFVRRRYAHPESNPMKTSIFVLTLALSIATASAASAKPEPDKGLELLMTYTVFHIGVYISLIAAFIGAGVFAKLDGALLRIAIAAFTVAGICGAAVASNIPETSLDFQTFWHSSIGPWGQHWMPAYTWATIEHLAFWIGILPIALGYALLGTKALKGQ